MKCGKVQNVISQSGLYKTQWKWTTFCWSYAGYLWKLQVRSSQNTHSRNCIEFKWLYFKWKKYLNTISLSLLIIFWKLVWSRLIIHIYISTETAHKSPLLGSVKNKNSLLWAKWPRWWTVRNCHFETLVFRDFFNKWSFWSTQLMNNS